MTKKINPPSIQETAFDCPHCGAYTTQFWYNVYGDSRDKNSIPNIPSKESLSHVLEDRETPRELKQNLLQWIDRISMGYVLLRKI